MPNTCRVQLYLVLNMSGTWKKYGQDDILKGKIVKCGRNYISDDAFLRQSPGVTLSGRHRLWGLLFHQLTTL